MPSLQGDGSPVGLRRADQIPARERGCSGVNDNPPETGGVQKRNRKTLRTVLTWLTLQGLAALLRWLLERFL